MPHAAFKKMPVAGRKRPPRSKSAIAAGKRAKRVAAKKKKSKSAYGADGFMESVGNWWHRMTKPSKPLYSPADRQKMKEIDAEYAAAKAKTAKDVKDKARYLMQLITKINGILGSQVIPTSSIATFERELKSMSAAKRTDTVKLYENMVSVAKKDPASLKAAAAKHERDEDARLAGNFFDGAAEYTGNLFGWKKSKKSKKPSQMGFLARQKVYMKALKAPRRR